MNINENGSDNSKPIISSIEALRLPASYGHTFGVKKVLTHVPVCKPKKQRFFRVHPDSDMAFDVFLLEDKENQDNYIVDPSMVQVITPLVRAMTIRAAIDRNDNVFLIPVPLPGEDGKRNQWHESLARAVQIAESQWIRISANMHAGAYDVFQAESSLSEPTWPTVNMVELLDVAFRGKVISTIDHPIIQSLLGRA